jgi:hypothetical protein
MSTTFSVFLLTGILQKLILRTLTLGERGSADADLFRVIGDDQRRNHEARPAPNKNLELRHLLAVGWMPSK